MKKLPLATLKEYLIITLATLEVTASVYFFMIPSHLAIGSISGLSVVLGEILPIPISAITFILNVVLLIFGFLTIGNEFGIKTIYSSLLVSGFLAMYENLFPNNVSLTGDSFLDMLGYIFGAGIGLAVLFNRNASSGGLDIIAKFLNKYLHFDLGKSMSTAGLVAAFSSIFVYDSKTVFLSILGTYLGGIVLDHFIMGFSVKKRVCIISDKTDEVVDYLLNTLHSGATLYEAVGAYDKQPKKEIITIVNRSEYSQLMTNLPKIDPNAFATIYNVGEVLHKHNR